MEKSIIILQTFGLGDCLFIEPIARKYFDEGYKVIWPVEDKDIWLKDYIKYVDFRKKSEFPMDYEQCRMDYTYEGIPVLPIRFSNPLLRGFAPHYGDDKQNWMLDKYRLLDLPLDMWRSLTWTRNHERENELYDFLKIKEPYSFGNMHYGGGFATYDFGVQTDVQLKKIKDFTLLDWTKIIINADVIHTVETSLVYMIETLPIKAREIHLHPRLPWEGGFTGVKNFISDRWILHPVEL